MAPTSRRSGGQTTAGTDGKPLPLGRPGAVARIAEIEKESGKEQAQAVRAKAEKLARDAGKRSISLEHVFKAEGRRYTPEELKEYRRAARGPVPAKRSKTTTAKSGTAKGAATKKSPAKRSGSGRGNAASAGSRSDHRATTSSGSRSSTPTSPQPVGNGTAQDAASAPSETES